MSEKIGLEAVLDDKDFQAGVTNYVGGVDKMNDANVKGGGSAKGLGSSIGSMAKVALGIGVASTVALGGALYSAVTAAAEEEVGIARLKAAVEASGTSYADVEGSIESYIATATKKTAFDDGDQRDALSRLTTTTGDYKQALDLMPLAMDLARAKGIDLASASDIVGKVAMGNTGILSRYGIVVEEGATAQEALATMQGRFAGQAEAYGSTFAGAQDKMGIALGNLKETVGSALLPVLTTLITKFADMATDLIPKVEQAMNDLWPIIQTAWSTIQTAIGTAWGIIKPIFDMLVSWLTGEGASTATGFGAQFSGVWNAIKSLIETVVPIVVDFIKAAFNGIKTFLDEHSEQIETVLQTAWDIIKNIIETTLGIIKGVIKLITDIIKGDWEAAWEDVKGIFKTIWDGIKDHVSLILGMLKTIFGEKLDEIKKTINGFLDNAKNAIADFSLADAGRNFIQSLADGITSATGAIVDAVKRAVRGAIQAALDALHMHSPSGVGLAIGYNFGASIGAGAMEGLGSLGGIGDALSSLTASAIGAGRVTAPAMMGGGTTVNNTYNLTAQYRNYQSEGSLRDTVRLLQAGVG